MITILRLGHRKNRDARLSTHIGLVARALGADEIIYTGEHDKNLLESINDVSKRWGGAFKTKYSGNWKKCLKQYRKKGFSVVHLTMYGLKIQKEISKIQKKKKLIIVVGGEKVPGEVYGMSDFNISVTNQPQSEVGALAILLHEYFKGKELSKQFRNAKIKIIPQKHGKDVLHF